MINFVKAVILGWCLGSAMGCRADHEANAAGPELNFSSRQGDERTQLIFAGIVPSPGGWHSNVYNFDVVTNRFSTLLQGESADPIVFGLGATALLFNRSFQSQNVRSINFSISENRLNVSKQMALSAGSVGDPHAVGFLDNEHVLLANYVKGSLQVWNPQTNGLADLAIAFALPEGRKLNPESLAVVSRGDGELRVFVAHQGLSYSQSMLVADGTQQIFVIDYKDGKFTPLDLDTATPAIDGIKISGSAPVLAPVTSTKEILVVSLCSRYVAMGSTLPESLHVPCQNAIESIDSSLLKIHSAWSDIDMSLYMNGSVTSDRLGHRVFASVETGTMTDPVQSVFEFDTENHKTREIYRYRKGSGGFWGLFFSDFNQILYVGDKRDNAGGILVGIDAEDSHKSWDIDSVPYSGAFVSVNK
jgi:hypothetical protein